MPGELVATDEDEGDLDDGDGQDDGIRDPDIGVDGNREDEEVLHGRQQGRIKDPAKRVHGCSLQWCEGTTIELRVLRSSVYMSVSFILCLRKENYTSNSIPYLGIFFKRYFVNYFMISTII